MENIVNMLLSHFLETQLSRGEDKIFHYVIMTTYSSTLESYFVTLKFLWHKLTKRYYVFTCKYIPSNLSKTLTTKRPANCIHGPCDTVHIKLWCPKVMHSWVVCKYVPRHIRSGTKTILQFLQFSTGQLSLSLDQATQGQRIVRDSCLSLHLTSSFTCK